MEVAAPELPQPVVLSPVALLRIQRSKVPPERFIREVIPRRRRAAMAAVEREKEEKTGRGIDGIGTSAKTS
jgi:hypothetical protein